MNPVTVGTRMAGALLGLWLALSLAGCGQSGPLYLPGNPSQVEAEAPPADSEDDDDKDEDDES